MRTTTKKFLLAAAVVAVAGSAAQAQHSEGKMYFRGGVGYSFGAGQVSGSKLGIRSYNRSDDKRTNAPFSLGKGIDVDLGFGYMVNPYVGFELGARYLMGLNSTFESKYEDEYNNVTTSNTSTTKVAHSSFALIPALRIVAPVGETFSLYSRLGVSLPLYSKVTIDYDRKTTGSSGSNSSEEISTEFSSYFKLGFSTALGVDVALSPNLSLFGEVNTLVTSFEAKKSTITKYMEDGKDVLADKTESQKVTEFQKEYTSKETDKTSPNQDVSSSTPASSVGVTVGLIFKF
jgi:opacity protein-like surface antigen